MTKVQYRVPGMTCGHCVSSVTEEVEKVDGVATVKVDLETKLVTISGENLRDRALRDAITEAGYEADPVPTSAS